VSVVTTDVSVELCASIIRVTRIGELGTRLSVSSSRRKLWSYTKLIKPQIVQSQTSAQHLMSTVRNVSLYLEAHFHRLVPTRWAWSCTWGCIRIKGTRNNNVIISPRIWHPLRVTLYLAFLRSVLRLLFTANVGPSYPILVTLSYLPPKRRFLQESHSVTFREMVLVTIVVICSQFL
jgi:hypothetical protein